jgi:hypothetical protein
MSLDNVLFFRFSGALSIIGLSFLSFILPGIIKHFSENLFIFSYSIAISCFLVGSVIVLESTSALIDFKLGALIISAIFVFISNFDCMLRRNYSQSTINPASPTLHAITAEDELSLIESDPVVIINEKNNATLRLIKVPIISVTLSEIIFIITTFINGISKGLYIAENQHSEYSSLISTLLYSMAISFIFGLYIELSPSLHTIRYVSLVFIPTSVPIGICCSLLGLKFEPIVNNIITVLFSGLNLYMVLITILPTIMLRPEKMLTMVGSILGFSCVWTYVYFCLN